MSQLDKQVRAVWLWVQARLLYSSQQVVCEKLATLELSEQLAYLQTLQQSLQDTARKSWWAGTRFDPNLKGKVVIQMANERKWRELKRFGARDGQANELCEALGIEIVTEEVEGKSVTYAVDDDEKLDFVYSGKHLGLRNSDGEIVHSTVPEAVEEADEAEAEAD